MNIEHRTSNIERRIVALLAIVALLLAPAALDAAGFGYNVTNNTLQGVNMALYESNSPGSYTLQQEQLIGASTILVLTNSVVVQATNGIVVQFTNQNSFASIGYLSKISSGLVPGGTLTGCNLSVLMTNYFTRINMAGYSSAVPTTNSSGAYSPAAPTIQPDPWALMATVALNAGLFTNVISTVAVPNTNQLWVSGAGSNQANGEYVYQNPQFAPGWIYTNVATTAGTPNGYICAQFGGTSNPGGNGDAMPFYMGPTTNDYSTATANNPFWYVSIISPVAYWTNGNNYLNSNVGGSGSGALPDPTVTYGTNYVFQTNLVWLCPSYFATEFSNGVIHVSQTGNDALAAQLQCAFATCQAAKQFAQAGDLIKVAPGTYVDHDLLKNGVNWCFDSPSTISWDDPQIDLNPRGMFDDYGGAVTSTITGDRLHFSVRSPVGWPAVLVTNPASWIVMKFNRGDYADYNFSLGVGNLPNVPLGPPVGGAISQLVYDQDGEYVDVTFNRVDAYTNAPVQMIAGVGGTFGQYQTVVQSDGGFGWSGGEEHIHVNSLIDTNGSLYAFESANRFTNESSCFFTADYVNGFTYWQDSNTNARTWLNIGYLVGAGAAGQGAALRYEGQAVNYYTGMKISGTGVNSGSDVIDMGAANDSGQRLWLNVEKITQNGKGSYINFAPGSHTLAWINSQFYEDNSGGQMTCGINVSGGTNVFSGGQLQLSNAPAITMTSGQASLQGMTLQTTGTNYDVEFLTTGATNGNLTLQNDILHSQTAANSIWTTNISATVSGTFMADVAPTNVVHLLGTTYYHTQTTQ